MGFEENILTGVKTCHMPHRECVHFGVVNGDDGNWAPFQNIPAWAIPGWVGGPMATYCPITFRGTWTAVWILFAMAAGGTPAATWRAQGRAPLWSKWVFRAPWFCESC